MNSKTVKIIEGIGDVAGDRVSAVSTENGTEDSVEQQERVPAVAACENSYHNPWARIRQLEAMILELNEKCLKLPELERNYNAALDGLQRLKTEVELLTKDREKYVNEAEFYEQQAAEKTTACESARERLQQCQRLLIDKDAVIKELEKKILQLQREIQNWQVKLTDCRRKPPAEDAEKDLHHKQYKRRKRSFEMTQTSLPTCRACNTVFDRVLPNEIECSFHRTPPQPLSAWQNEIAELDGKINSANIHAYKYWPCCGKYGVKQQPGCLKLRDHDIVNTDDTG